MSRPLGLPKTGGREKGTPNKKTEYLRDAFSELDFDVPQKLVNILPSLPPEKQADILLSLMGFLYPKRKTIEHDIEFNRSRSMFNTF